MITYHRTSILTSRAQTVVNTVNTVGVMGKGLASEFKSLYPEMFSKYKEYCDLGILTIGKLWLWKGQDQWVLNFPTKKHWKNPSKIEYIEFGLKKFVEQYELQGITEIAFPRLGCGNGGLNWEDIKPLMENYLSNLHIPVYIHDYEKDIGQPEHAGQIENMSLFENNHQIKDKSFDRFKIIFSDFIEERKNIFFTLKLKKQFKVFLKSDGDFLFIAGKKKLSVSDEDMRLIWDMLMRGPITTEQVSGSARPAIYFLFSALSMLSFIRVFSVADRRGRETIAVELAKKIAAVSVHQN
jgi:O-acetyl-ADP-ribose deacetylase (regulator of RNase III)